MVPARGYGDHVRKFGWGRGGNIRAINVSHRTPVNHSSVRLKSKAVSVPGSDRHHIREVRREVRVRATVFGPNGYCAIRPEGQAVRWSGGDGSYVCQVRRNVVGAGIVIPSQCDDCSVVAESQTKVLTRSNSNGVGPGGSRPEAPEHDFTGSADVDGRSYKA